MGYAVQTSTRTMLSLSQKWGAFFFYPPPNRESLKIIQLCLILSDLDNVFIDGSSRKSRAIRHTSKRTVSVTCRLLRLVVHALLSQTLTANTLFLLKKRPWAFSAPQRAAPATRRWICRTPSANRSSGSSPHRWSHSICTGESDFVFILALNWNDRPPVDRRLSIDRESLEGLASPETFPSCRSDEKNSSTLFMF